MNALQLFPAALLLIALGWMYWHVRSWREVRAEDLEDAERQFQWRRFRRRMQASGMLALLAVAMAVGLALPPKRYPVLYVWYWYAVVFLVFWLCLLALADLIASRAHYTRLKRDYRVEQAKLAAHIEQVKAQHRHQSNGSPP